MIPTGNYPKFVGSNSSVMRSTMPTFSGTGAKSVMGQTQMSGAPSVMASATGGANKSSMLEQEMKAIRKIKEKQRKEIEQMIDLEMKMAEIKERNEANMQK